MTKIFISYSRQDSLFAESLVEILREHYGHDNVWHDQRLHAGTNWWQTILDRIGWADVFLYLLSNDSVESRFCRAEFTEATRLNKPYVFVQVRGKTNLPKELARYHYLDMSQQGVNDARALTRLYNSIREQAALPKIRRAKWTPATPNPDDAPEYIAPVSDAPEVDLVAPQAPRDAIPNTPPRRPMPKSSSQGWLAMAGIILVLALALIGGVLLMNGGDDDERPTPTQTEVAAQPTSTPRPSLTSPPSATATPSESPTPSDTPDIVAVVETLDAQATAAVRATNIASTATQAILFAEATSTEIAASTATAASWTDTPTPDYTASVEAFLDSRATATEAAIRTATADSWTATPTPIPLGETGNPVTANSQWTPVIQEFDGVEMVKVPAGCFMMGSDDGEKDEKPVHQQCFAQPFWIDRTEVTNAQFAAFDGVADRESQRPDDNRPRERITWFEARYYCESRGGRLPTEAEWEYAARGPDGLIYPWGDEFVAENAVYGENSSNQTAEVGSHHGGASWVGALDMSGNVWEWVGSAYVGYPYAAEDGREEIDSHSDARSVLRGGSFLSGTGLLRAAYRDYFAATYTFSNYGFRCARSG